MAALVTPAARVSELMAQGRKSAAALLQIQGHDGIRELAAEVLRCCDRALAALHGKAGRKKRKLGLQGAATQTTRPKRRTRTINGETAAATRVERKHNWDDGFVWTKYGQKDIRGSDHPRHYFRCANYTLDAGGCPARRQVQRSEEHDHPLYVITYFADHACCHGAEAMAALDDIKILDFGSVGSRSPRPDELPAEVAKVVSTPLSDLRPVGKVAELSSSADDIHCSTSWASGSWDPSAVVCSDWDFFGNCSFNYVSEFFDVEDITLYR